jgi:hypothetical protein
MKNGTSVLYPNDKVAERVTAYAEAHSTPLPKHITDYHAHIEATSDRADYMISDFQTQAHFWLAKVIGAKRGRSFPIYYTDRGLGGLGGGKVNLAKNRLSPLLLIRSVFRLKYLRLESLLVTRLWVGHMPSAPMVK